MMRNSSLLILEIIWITLGLLCVAIAIRSAFNNAINKIPVFAVMALVCFLFAWIRDRQRKKS